MEQVFAASTANATMRSEGPLTVEVMNTLENAQNMACEIASRLYGLRDRLTGSPPEEKANGLGASKEPLHFKGAHADKAALLIATLNNIDSISMDLANRL